VENRFPSLKKSFEKNWILDGAPSFEVNKPVRDFISPKEMFKNLATDILDQPRKGRQ